MKAKGKPAAADELRPEYDFSKLKGGARGKYFESYRSLVRLDRDVAQAFPDEAAVNDALRAVLKSSEADKSKKRRSKRMEPTRG
jgi:hypothetical protein